MFSGGNQLVRLNRASPLAKFVRAQWPCDEGGGTVCRDISGNAQTDLGSASNPTMQQMVVVNTVGRKSDAQRGKVLSFTGAGYLGAFGNGATNGSSCMMCNFTTGSLSWSCWAKIPISFGASFPGLVSKRATANGAASAGWGTQVRTDGGFIGFPYVDVSDGTNNPNVTWGSAKHDNLWHLIVGVVDRQTQLLKLSVDAQAFGTVSISAVGSLSTPSDQVRFGTRPDGSGPQNNPYTGLLSDVRVWADHALTLGEIAHLYADRPNALIPKQRLFHPAAAAAAAAQQTAVSIITG